MASQQSLISGHNSTKHQYILSTISFYQSLAALHACGSSRNKAICWPAMNLSTQSQQAQSLFVVQYTENYMTTHADILACAKCTVENDH